MSDRRREIILKHYNDRLKIYGHDPRTLGWFKGRQKIRFKVLSEIGNMDKCSILDVGCGFGDLYGFLVKNGLDIDYLGIDINPNLIKIAKDSHPMARFIVKDILDMKEKCSFDYVLASGLFEFKLKNQEVVLNDMIRKMFVVCKKGFAADFLSSYVDYETEDAFHAEPESIFSFCKTLSRRVTIRHDYLPFEFCIYVYHPRLNGIT